MCLPSSITSSAPFFASLTHFCQAQREPSDNTIYVQERTVKIDVSRRYGRVNVEVWRADNEDVVYLNADISKLGQLAFCSFTKSQIKAIRAKILASLPA